MAQLGADVEQLDGLSRVLGDAARRIEATASDLTHQLSATMWLGRDADRFRSTWAGSYVGQLRTITARVEALAADVRRQAAAQRQGSDGGFVPDGVPSGGPRVGSPGGQGAPGGVSNFIDWEHYAGGRRPSREATETWGSTGEYTGGSWRSWNDSGSGPGNVIDIGVQAHGESLQVAHGGVQTPYGSQSGGVYYGGRASTDSLLDLNQRGMGAWTNSAVQGGVGAYGEVVMGNEHGPISQTWRAEGDAGLWAETNTGAYLGANRAGSMLGADVGVGVRGQLTESRTYLGGLIGTSGTLGGSAGFVAGAEGGFDATWSMEEVSIDLSLGMGLGLKGDLDVGLTFKPQGIVDAVGSWFD